MTAHPMEQHPSESEEPPPPGDPTSLPEAIEAARAERDEQGRVVLVRARALREAVDRMNAIPAPSADEYLTEAGEELANRRTTASLNAAEAWDLLREADVDLATIERRVARLEAEQGAPPLDEEAYQRARAVGQADRDEARGGAAGMMRRGA